jgi:hypothetical protein
MIHLVFANFSEVKRQNGETGPNFTLRRSKKASRSAASDPIDREW